VAFLTRQDLIGRNTWPTTTVQTGEQGPIRVAKPTSQGALRIQELHGATEAQRMAAALQVTCVNEHGAPLFADEAAAAAFLDGISFETLTKVVREAGKLAAPEQTEPAEGKSGA